MKRFKSFKPAFWDSQHKDSHGHVHLSFARKWKLIVLFTSLMALSPLVVMTFVEFSLTRRIIVDEVKMSMSKILDTAAASVIFAGDQKKTVLDLAVRLNSGAGNDLFVVNEAGILLTPSFYYGKPDNSTAIDPGMFKGQNGIETAVTKTGTPVLAGYSRIPGSLLVFVLAKNEKQLTHLYFTPRLKLAGYLSISIVLVIVSIMGMATYLIRRIHAADEKRIDALHHAEYANKLASIGRLASGVAHEINNPLAIINQKTGLILDLMTLREEALSSDDRVIALGNDVLEAVKRCGTITRQLLDFARHMEPSIQPVNIREVIDQVLAFLDKEAQKRQVKISVAAKETIQGFESDMGCLQQIFLNLFENAFTAMEDGGRLEITLGLKKNKTIVITVSDNGIGIPPENINKIFEPFYSSKTGHWGTGHGLSITYGLVKEIGGDIMVKSELGKGTCFTLILPLTPLLTKEANGNG